MNRLLGALTAIIAIAGCVPQGGGDANSTESSLTAPILHLDCLVEPAAWTIPVDSSGNSSGWWSSNPAMITNNAGYSVDTSCPFGVVDFALRDPAPTSEFAIDVQGEVALDADECPSSSALSVEI